MNKNAWSPLVFETLLYVSLNYFLWGFFFNRTEPPRIELRSSFQILSTYYATPISHDVSQTKGRLVAVARAASSRTGTLLPWNGGAARGLSIPRRVNEPRRTGGNRLSPGRAT